ncbi:hypothetical protein FRB93_013718 [Tulasnella sp. JGI-2019a]|nr:hypothetical protein FRB93_013718 [Tulasnella sp. JGI-2019a]
MYFVLSESQPLSRPRPICLATPGGGIFIPELLMLIFSEMVPKDLVSAALVCRAWSMASRMLWSTHEVPLSALLRMMGFLAAEKTCAPGRMQHYGVASGSLEPIAWMTLIHRYSHIITRLRIESVLDESALDILRQALDLYGDSLFLRLHSITFDMSAMPDVSWKTNDVATSMLKTILSPSPMEVQFERHEDDGRVVDICRSLASLCSHLTHLTLGTPRKVDSDYFTFSCHGFSDLKTLAICDWRWEGWSALGAPPGLEEITITDSGVSERDDFGPQIPVTTLPSLRTLTISLATLCRAALLEAAMPALRSLTVSDLLETDGDISEAISERSPLLEHLDIRFAETCITSRMTMALSTLHSLRTLHLGGWTTLVELNDSDITPLVRSLNHLENLSIVLDVTEHGTRGIPKLTGSSFLAILHHCNVLKELNIQLNLSKFSLVEAQLVTSVTPSETLTQLTLSGSSLPPSDRLDRLPRDLAVCCRQIALLNIRGSNWTHVQEMEFVGAFDRYQRLGAIS